MVQTLSGKADYQSIVDKYEIFLFDCGQSNQPPTPPLSPLGSPRLAVAKADANPCGRILDGVIWEGDHCIDNVKQVLDHLRSLNKQIYFVTNNATSVRTPAPPSSPPPGGAPSWPVVTERPS